MIPDLLLRVRCFNQDETDLYITNLSSENAVTQHLFQQSGPLNRSYRPHPDFVSRTFRMIRLAAHLSQRNQSAQNQLK